MTPDGKRYVHMGRGGRAPSPFYLRRLIPWLCRDIGWRWLASTYTSLVAHWMHPWRGSGL